MVPVRHGCLDGDLKLIFMAIVAIVGRPNVGKSTLFNRLTGRRDAIVGPESGVTRDRHYGQSDWNGITFSVIDTGGYVDNSGDVFEQEIKKQVNLAVDEADAILFMVDTREGVTPMDEDVAMLLRRSRKPVFLVANKVDSHKQVNETGDFYALGLGEIYAISAINGSGTGELLDALVATMNQEQGMDYEAIEEEIPRIAIVGRPNAGKSSLINLLLGDDRNIVTDKPGTTRDSIHSKYNRYGMDFILIDTAGIRKKNKVHEDIEFYSVMRAVRSIEYSDVCMLMIDAERGMEGQDLNIFWLIQRNHKGVVILVNKWDLIAKGNQTLKEYEAIVRDKIAPYRDVPIVFTSVTEKQRIFKAMEIATEVYRRKTVKIPTRKLNDIMLPIMQDQPPPRVKDKTIKVKYMTQLPKAYPVFICFCNHPQYVKEPYARFIENKLREHFDFTGVPIEIFFRKK